MAKAADEGRLRKLRKEAQRENRLAKKRLQQEQGGKGTKQKPLQEAKSWASDEDEFTETLPRKDSGQGGRHPLVCALVCFVIQFRVALVCMLQLVCNRVSVLPECEIDWLQLCAP